MFQPIDGGSAQRIEFGDEFIEVHLPPIGYVVDRMPDPKTGKPSEKLIKSEILFEDLPLVDKKWQRTTLPKNWNKWLEEEALNKQLNPNYSHAEADYFRAQEWRRRINGVWIAIGNKNKKPVDYVYLTGCHYLYLNWWDPGFEVKFRFIDTWTFYTLLWSEENPQCTGVIQAALRRSGKSVKAAVWFYDDISRRRFVHGGLQAQKMDDAKEAFIENVVGPFTRLPEFFRPKYDDSGELKGGMFFKRKISKGKKSVLNFSEDDSLNSRLTYKETSEKAYDKAKLKRYIAEEPGKWTGAKIYETYLRIQPTFFDGYYIVGKGFLPTTIEEMADGGASFVELAEDSMPSLMNKYSGRTKSGLIFSFIPAYLAHVFDEYGRSISDDPNPNDIVIDEKGNRILEGAKTKLLARRKVVEDNLMKLTEEIRKYAFTWEEAKSVSNQFCHFNHMLLEKRLTDLNSLPTPLYVTGNFNWTKGKDSDVDFFRDDHKGRWKITWLPDNNGDGGENTNGFKIANNVGEDWDSENGRKVYYPKNDHLFAMGVDPIRNIATDDPTASKAAMYILRKYDPHIDAGKPEQKPGLPKELQFKTNKFIVEYLVRPEDPDAFHEDMIMTCRYFSVSMFEEGNVQTLRQHFIFRGYSAFLVNRGHFSDDALPGVKKDGAYADKSVSTDVVVTHNLVNTLNMYYNRYIDLVDFPDLLSDSKVFRIKKHHKKDAVFGAGYTLTSAQRNFEAPDIIDNKRPIELELFPVYDQSGTQSVEVDISELMF